MENAMFGFIDKLAHCTCSFRVPGDPRKVNSTYVSEFTGFIGHYLDEHPEVVADQRTGRLIYWEKRVDLAAQAAAERESAPSDGYGFYWHHGTQH